MRIYFCLREKVIGKEEKNKWAKWAKHHSSIGQEEHPNVDFGEIIRNGRENFRNNFSF